MSGGKWDVTVRWKDGYPAEKHAELAVVVDAVTVQASATTQLEIVKYGAVDTGYLMGSTHPEHAGDMAGYVVVGANYAKYVHDGSHYMNAPEDVAGYKFGEFLPAELWGLFPGRVRYHEPRPFLRDAMRIIKPRFLEAVKAVLTH